jgi:hypothetical protein
MSAGAPETIGLIAGSGRLPLLFAESARRQGLRVFAVAHKGESDPALEGAVDALTWVRVGQIGKILEALKGAGVTRAAMAGGIAKVRFFSGARPDWLAVKMLAQLRGFAGTGAAPERGPALGDDKLLRFIAAVFEKEGVRIVPASAFMPDRLARRGLYTRRGPSAEEHKDLEFGLQLARRFGELDIGQTVVVKQGIVLAVEAIEGTDACIRRGGELSHGGGAVVVKVSKPGQDTRFDLPAVGPETIKAMREAGAVALGLEAGGALVLDEAELVRRADKAKIAVVGL